jgi:hypothetical protein
LPQLRELRAAARRLNADHALSTMQAAFAAFAAVMTKEGQKIFAQHQKALMKQTANE